MSVANYADIFYYAVWVVLLCVKHDKKIDAMFSKDFNKDSIDSICLG